MNEEMQNRVKELERENADLKREYRYVNNMLVCEENKHRNMLDSLWTGISQTLYSKIRIETEAMRDLLEYLDEENGKRLMRRLNRIDSILNEVV